MQRIGEKLLGEVLKEYVRESGLAERMQGLDVCDVWRQAVGPRVAAATLDHLFQGWHSVLPHVFVFCQKYAVLQSSRNHKHDQCQDCRDLRSGK